MIRKAESFFRIFSPKKRLFPAGLTLVELLVVIVLAVIVTSVVSLTLRAGLGSWQIGEGEIALQRQAQRIMEEIIEGKDDIPGIREALSVVEADVNSLGVVPLWEDIYRNYQKEEAEFVLTKPFSPGAPLPIGQMKTPGSKKYISVPAVFLYDEDGTSRAGGNTVKFLNSVPRGSDVRLLYFPDASGDSSVIMRYYWDRNSRKIFREYRGRKEEVVKYDRNVNIADLKFLYYDNLNNMLSVGKKSSLSAVGIDFIVEKNNVLRELSSFVSIRGLGGNLGSGLALNEEMEVLIPDSKQIRTLALDNIWGISDDDKLDIEISGYGRTWKISIDFGISGAEPSILGFNIEYPPGSVVYTNKRIRPAKSGLNLLKLGNDYYDYDDDANVEDIVDVSGEEVKFRVTRMDISAAAIFVRP